MLVNSRRKKKWFVVNNFYRIYIFFLFLSLHSLLSYITSKQQKSMGIKNFLYNSMYVIYTHFKHNNGCLVVIESHTINNAIFRSAVMPMPIVVIPLKIYFAFFLQFYFILIWSRARKEKKLNKIFLIYFVFVSLYSSWKGNVHKSVKPKINNLML